MGSFGLQRFNMAEIYATYRDIVSGNEHKSSRESLNMLSKSLEARGLTRDTIFNELLKLVCLLDLSKDSHQFNYFYGFVFFIFRENGHKNISVSRAISAWRLLLTGRFRLLNQWCNFVEKYQRHNITEDTWQQLLAFSRYVNDDLEIYDPNGAWPYLIDDFVEYISSTRDLSCNYDGNESQPGISSSCRGLNPNPRTKRPLADIGHTVGSPKTLEDLTSLNHLMRLKRCKLRCLDSDAAMSGFGSPADYHGDSSRSDSVLQTSACAVDSLSKGFEGHLSIGHGLQFDKKRVSYTGGCRVEI